MQLFYIKNLGSWHVRVNTPTGAQLLDVVQQIFYQRRHTYTHAPGSYFGHILVGIHEVHCSGANPHGVQQILQNTSSWWIKLGKVGSECQSIASHSL